MVRKFCCSSFISRWMHSGSSNPRKSRAPLSPRCRSYDELQQMAGRLEEEPATLLIFRERLPKLDCNLSCMHLCQEETPYLVQEVTVQLKVPE